MDKNKKAVWQTWLRRGVLGILLMMAAALVWCSAQPPAPQPLPSATPAVTAASQRSLRETAYDKDVAALEALLASGAADTATQAQAAAHLEELIAAHQSELAVEALLQQAGYEGCMVVINGSAVTVLIPAQQLNTQNSAAVLSLCAAHANVGADSIRLMPME